MGRSHSLVVFLRYKHCSAEEFFIQKKYQLQAFLAQRRRYIVSVCMFMLL